LARRFSIPSFLTNKRSRLITTAVAGTLVVGAVATTAAATLASHPGVALAGNADTSMMVVTPQQAAKAGDTMSPAQGLAGFDRVRFSLGEIQNQDDVAAAKAAAVKAEAAKAAAAAAAKATAAKAAAAQQTAVRTPSGSPIQIAQQMLGQFGWSPSEFSCLYPLWEHESGWNPAAENAGSGAYGIPQSLPGSQMASAGADWQTDAATQIRWGLTYIHGRYGSPCGAWAHEQANNWY
jgi:hypothetical protein